MSNDMSAWEQRQGLAIAANDTWGRGGAAFAAALWELLAPQGGGGVAAFHAARANWHAFTPEAEA